MRYIQEPLRSCFDRNALRYTHIATKEALKIAIPLDTV
jgi:hypothetical protein